jgi:hypothetical protein
MRDTRKKWVKGKLLPLDEIKERSPRLVKRDHYTSVYHTKVNMCIDVEHNKSGLFDKLKDITIWSKETNRTIYEDVHRNLYYDEWFEWIDKEPPIVEPLSDDLWDISDW